MNIISSFDSFVNMSSRGPTRQSYLLAFVFSVVLLNSPTTPKPSKEACVGDKWSCKGRCNELRSLPCSCDIRCLVYRTCCEDYSDVCDFTSDPLFSNLSKFFNVSSIEIDNYAFIDECINKTDSDDVKHCESSSPVVEIGRIGPVTDRSLGLQFKNGACLRCNDLEDFMPWPLETLCDKGLLETFGRLDLSTIGKLCNIYLRPPSVNSSLFNPVYRLKMSDQVLDRGKCSPEHEQLCQSFFSYVEVSTPWVSEYLFRNWYCVMCSGWTEVTCTVPVFEELIPHGVATFSSLLNWNIDGSWTVTSSTGFPRGETMDTVCGLDPDTDQETCKVINCPNSSVPVFESTYCLPVPIPVRVMLTVQSERTGVLPLSSDVLRNWGCSNQYLMHQDVSWITFLITCHWAPTYQADAQQQATIFNVLSSSVKPYIGQSKVTGMKIMYLSVFHFVIPESVLLFNPNQLQSPVPPDSFEWAVSIIGSALSLVSLCSRITIQPLSHLLNSQPGRMQCCLCVSLALAYVSFLLTQGLQQDSLPCWVVSILMHLFYLCSLFWMNAITVDLWKRFRYGRILSSISESRSMKLIVLYTCLLPLVIVGVSVSMDLVLPNNEFSPAYGQHLCWINNSYSLVIFFVVPVSFLSFVNAVLVLFTFKSLHKHHKTSKFIQTLSKSSPVLSIGICAKMASLTGVTWLLGVVAGFVDHFILWLIFSAVNSSYGLIVAVTLMYNRRLWHSIEITCRKRISVAHPGDAQVSPGGNSGPGGHNSYQRTTDTLAK